MVPEETEQEPRSVLHRGRQTGAQGTIKKDMFGLSLSLKCHQVGNKGKGVPGRGTVYAKAGDANGYGMFWEQCVALCSWCGQAEWEGV